MESPAQTFAFWAYIALITSICVLGLFGNGLSLIVLLQKRMRNSTTVILVGLVMSDILILFPGLMINSFGIILLRCYFERDVEIEPAAVTVFRVFYPLKKIGHMASVYITILITVERYIAVCWPFHVKTLVTVRKSVWWTSGIFAGSVIYNFPRFFERWEVRLGNGSVLESTSASTSQEDSYAYRQYSHGWIKTTVHYILPFLVLLLFNSLIYRKILSRNKSMMSWSQARAPRPATLSPFQTKRLQFESSLTKMLLAIVLIFMLCNTGQGVCDWIYISRGGQSSVVADAVSALLLMLNAALNFLIYCTMGTKFRGQLARILPPNRICCWELRGPLQPPTSSSATQDPPKSAQ